MKTAISIPDPEFEAAEKLAASLGMSRSELYRKAIAEYVARHSDESITARINETYDLENKDTAMDSQLLQMQEQSIPREDW
jgi:metal-responsive CopG/Arc/MetJ family transcriptional regulator